MDLYIDCEWNSYKGDLISMALMPKGGDPFYEVIDYSNMVIDPWVAEHVIPVLNKDSVSFEVFQYKLKQFLKPFDTVNIISDWPEDIEHFCQVLITGPGSRLSTPPMSMKIVRIDSESLIPHNALADAIGIRRALLGT
jgi:hypothetical protein